MPWQSTGADPEVLAVRYDPVKRVIYTAGNDHSIRVRAAAGRVE